MWRIVRVAALAWFWLTIGVFGLAFVVLILGTAIGIVGEALGFDMDWLW